MLKLFLRSLYLLVMLSLVAAPGLQLFPTPANAQDVVAILDPVQGLVQMQPTGADPQDDASWRTVTRRAPVNEGDRIRTASTGMAFLRFFEGIQTEVGPNTLVIVSTLALPDAESDNLNISMDLLVGTTLTNVEMALDASDRFEIHTPGATAVVRGTAWWTVVEPDGSSAFMNEEGAVNVIPRIQGLGVPPASTAAPAEDATADDAVGEGDMAAEMGEEPEAAAAPADVDVRAMPTYTQMEGVGMAMVVSNGQGMITDGSGLPVAMYAPGEAETPQWPAAAPMAMETCGNGVCEPGEEDNCPLDCLDPEMMANCCGNDLCETDLGEDLITCSQDCGPWSGSDCGNGVCDPDESGLSCPADCAADDTFDSYNPDLCGNGVCDPTESALNCASDCAAPRLEDAPPPDAPPANGDAAGDADGTAGDDATTDPSAGRCTLTGDNINVRRGPGTGYAVRGTLATGETLTASGLSPDGLWFLVDHPAGQAWVASWVVTAVGPCGALPTVQPVGPPPDNTDDTSLGDDSRPAPDDGANDADDDTRPAPDLDGTPPGTWGACGSCADCGPYPAIECMINPRGECVWNPAVCRDGDTVPDDGTLTGRLLAPPVADCPVGDYIFVNARYAPPTGSSAVIGSFDAWSTGPAVSIYHTLLLDPLRFEIKLDCLGPVGATEIVTAHIIDTDGVGYSAAITVQIN
ncbi:MAG: SH3 domain-containing protein [Chloroflexi bacterium]|nr:SH3 domain-containing protein [Chloroflexota bacterium]